MDEKSRHSTIKVGNKLIQNYDLIGLTVIRIIQSKGKNFFLQTFRFVVLQVIQPVFQDHVIV